MTQSDIKYKDSAMQKPEILRSEMSFNSELLYRDQ